MVDVSRMHPSFASSPLPCHWDTQPCPRAALPKSSLELLPYRITLPRAPRSTWGDFWSQQSAQGEVPLVKW